MWSGHWLEGAILPEGDGSFLIILFLVFILVIVLLLMVLHSYSSRLKDAETALVREVDARRRLSASIKERTAEGERLRKRLSDAEAAGVASPMQPAPSPQDFVSYGEVEAVRMYAKEPEKSPSYNLLSDESDKELAAFLGLEEEDEEKTEKRGKDDEDGEGDGNEGDGSAKKVTIRILDVFLIYKDGRLLFHLSKKQRLVDQSQQVGAMLTALQGFVKMSLDRDRGGTMDELVSGKLCIVMEYGELANIAVVLEGRGTEELRKCMRNALKEIHKENYAELFAWDGRDQTLGGEEAIIRKHITGEYETEEFHNANVEILDLSGAGTFKVKDGEEKGNEEEKESYPDKGWGM